MAPSDDQALSGAIFEESALLTLEELSRMCAVDERHIVEFVEEGVIQRRQCQQRRMAFQRDCAAPRTLRAAPRAGS